MSSAIESTLPGVDETQGRHPREPKATVRRPTATPAVLLGAVGIAAVAVVLYFTVRVELWLDETLSVNIARLPLTQIPDALRQDGGAPLYYLLLHLWIGAFGESNLAVRSLSGVAVLAALPAVWLAARRVGGTWAAWTAAALLATSPFAVTYATQARMYALLLMFTSLGYLALTSVLDRVTPVRVVLLGLCSGLLMLTHYWSFYLLATVGGVLLASLVWTRRAGAFWAAVGVAGGGILMLPWLPVLLFQLGRTGTPWGSPSSYRFLLDIGEYFADTGRARWYLVTATPYGRLLGLLFVVLAGLAVLRTRTATAGREPQEAAASRRHCLPLAAVVVGTALLAITLGKFKTVSFESRYLAVVLVPFLVLVATGAGLVASRWLRVVVTAALVSLSAVGSVANIGAERSHAPAIAAAIEAFARPGDVVGYCPDQLAPPVDRLLRSDLRQVTFPTGSTPERVNWVDYGARIAAEDAASFARSLDRMAGPGRDVWLVWADGYGSFGDKCGAISRELGVLRPAPDQPVVLPVSTSFFEPSVLLRYSPQR